MKATYNITIDFQMTYEVDTEVDLKEPMELAFDIAAMVMDELPLVEGTGFFHIMDAKRFIEE